jgi:hypothetical protein
LSPRASDSRDRLLADHLDHRRPALFRPFLTGAKNVDRRELHHERLDAVERRDQPRRRARLRRRIGWHQRFAVTADMQDDRAAFEQRNSVVAVAWHLAERLFLEIVGRAFCDGVELAHGIGNAGFLERPARAQIADMALREGRHPLEGADADGSLGIDGHWVSPPKGFRRI